MKKWICVLLLLLCSLTACDATGSPQESETAQESLPAPASEPAQTSRPPATFPAAVLDAFADAGVIEIPARPEKEDNDEKTQVLKLTLSNSAEIFLDANGYIIMENPDLPPILLVSAGENILSLKYALPTRDQFIYTRTDSEGRLSYWLYDTYHDKAHPIAPSEEVYDGQIDEWMPLAANPYTMVSIRQSGAPVFLETDLHRRTSNIIPLDGIMGTELVDAAFLYYLDYMIAITRDDTAYYVDIWNLKSCINYYHVALPALECLVLEAGYDNGFYVNCYDNASGTAKQFAITPEEVEAPPPPDIELPFFMQEVITLQPGHWYMDFQWVTLDGGLIALVADGSPEDMSNGYDKTIYFIDWKRGEVVATYALEQFCEVVLGTMGDKIVLAEHNNEQGYNGIVSVYGAKGLPKHHYIGDEHNWESVEAWIEDWKLRCDYETMAFWGEWQYLHPQYADEGDELCRIAAYKDKTLYSNWNWYSDTWVLADGEVERQLGFDAPRGVVLYNSSPGKWISPKLERLILCSSDGYKYVTYWLADMNTGDLMEIMRVEKAAWQNITAGFISESRGFLIGQSTLDGMWGLWIFELGDIAAGQ